MLGATFLMCAGVVPGVFVIVSGNVPGDIMDGSAAWVCGTPYPASGLRMSGCISVPELALE